MHHPEAERSHARAESGLIDALSEAEHGRCQALVTVMQAHNQRLYRIARAILGDDMEAEDIVQEAYIRAFTAAAQLRDDRKLGAWLAKITANLALSRQRQRNLRQSLLAQAPENQAGHLPQQIDTMTPERHTALHEIRMLVEHEIDQLPDAYRQVFILRIVEQMSTQETASVLKIGPQTVKSRLHRARQQLALRLQKQIDMATLSAFPFAGRRCQRICAAVLQRLFGYGPDFDKAQYH